MSHGKHRMSKTRSGRLSWLSTGLVIGLLAAMSLPVTAAGGPTDKATGSGYWTNSAELDFYGEFNAHEAFDNRAAKGALLQQLTDGSSGFTVDVTGVVVGDGYACFWGITDSAWGVWASRLGQLRWTYVVDNGEPGVGVDLFEGAWSSVPASCAGGTETGSNTFTGGNVQIHLGQSYDS